MHLHRMAVPSGPIVVVNGLQITCTYTTKAPVELSVFVVNGLQITTTYTLLDDIKQILQVVNGLQIT